MTNPARRYRAELLNIIIEIEYRIRYEGKEAECLDLLKLLGDEAERVTA